MEKSLAIIGRSKPLLLTELDIYRDELRRIVGHSRFLVVGAGGSIGRQVCIEIFKRAARCLHAVDLSENGLVELVRDIRSSEGYTTKDFQTFALDIGSEQFEQFFRSMGGYDYVINLSALKHVRSESNPFTLSRMIEVNIFNSIKLYNLSKEYDAKKYFCVSTDKAANPVNLMGASKRAMELCLLREVNQLPVSSARFANVAFSGGSLLEGFEYRFKKCQPLSVPSDIERYFMTEAEAGQICLLSALLGKNCEIFFPSSPNELKLINLKRVAENFLKSKGKIPKFVDSEEDARAFPLIDNTSTEWPLYSFESGTTGEKAFEEFFTHNEVVLYEPFFEIARVSFTAGKTSDEIAAFLQDIQLIRLESKNAYQDFIDVFEAFIHDFNHFSTGSFLDQRM